MRDHTNVAVQCLAQDLFPPEEQRTGNERQRQEIEGDKREGGKGCKSWEQRTASA